MEQKEINKLCDQLKEDVRKLTEKYEQLSILVIVEEAERQEHVEIVGNLCPLCALDNLANMIQRHNLQHLRPDSPNAVMVKESNLKH